MSSPIDERDTTTTVGMAAYWTWTKALAVEIGVPSTTPQSIVNMMSTPTERAFEAGLAPSQFLDLPLSDPIWVEEY
jgi:hypothetical protein